MKTNNYIFTPELVTIHERIEFLVKQYAGGKNTVFAERLGINEANVRSYIKGVLPKADVLEKIVKSYEVNALWLLTGLGYASMPNEQPEQPPKTLTAEASIADFFHQFDPFIQRKDAKIVQQAEEIGRLKARIEELERSRGASVSDVAGDSIARVG
ncbi:MAG: helix-turn-helix transcriptional regulator [Paludibacteraceae bacterium]|nr:helix-turn-helix transcriptional regulator [Paludibacteraceae bacterium]